MKRDINFDYIRVAAMSAIILCHFFQILNCALATWLNIGVQIFLLISAKLLSNKKFNSASDVVSFLKSRVLRIYIPMWIYLICLIPVLFVVGRGPDVSAIIMYFIGAAGFAKSGILGLGHFWYISVLLICYLLVPVMYKIAQYCEKQGRVKTAVLKILIPVVAVVFFTFTPYKTYGVNIALFCVAYFMFYSTKADDVWCKGKAIRLLPVALILVVIRLWLDTKEIVNNLYYDGIFVSAVKAVVGFFLFFAVYEALSRLKVKQCKIIDYFSNISYEVYIVHQFILLALYEFIPFFKSEIVGRVAMLACALIMTFLNAIVVFYVKKFIEKRVIKK